MYSVISWLLIVGMNVITSIPGCSAYDSVHFLSVHLQIILSILFSCLGICCPFFVFSRLYCSSKNV